MLKKKQNIINHIWYEKNIFCYFLFPISLLYRFIISMRKFLYKIKLFKSHKINIPVIVVGNITVGGTGKTPLVIALVKSLQKQGFSPAVITRGYGGKNKVWPHYVDENSDPLLVGDEAVLIAKNTGVPVVAGPNRVADALLLLRRDKSRLYECNIIISDDGLQHYALARDIEIAVIDSTRRFGNGFCLPAGPLREPKNRLKTVDFIVANGKANPGEFEMQFVIDDIINLNDNNKKLNLSELSHKKIMAVAGIGNPERFFESLRACTISFTTKIFPDHHAFSKNDFDCIHADIILMTEKDAIKCNSFADDRFCVVRGHAVIDEMLFQAVIARTK